MKHTVFSSLEFAPMCFVTHLHNYIIPSAPSDNELAYQDY